ncbi:MAG: hypothetical protein SOI26_08285 [Coriobacteriales bacterium]|jgi:hypothetical protein
MERMRLMDKPEDFEKLGINPKEVEEWEDGRRGTDAAGENGVWYFDATFDDGTKSVVAFRPKEPAKMAQAGDSPNLNIAITAPDGRTMQEFAYATAEDSHIGTSRCDVHFGPHHCTGDFKDYDVHVAETNGLACDLHYHALVEPFRQGTSIVALGDEDQYHYTDLSVPKCAVTGRLLYDGSWHEVRGFGYHDHQWMNISPFQAFHHWFWGRMYTDKHVVYIYEFVGNERFGFTHVPFFMVADNETGKIEFSTNGNFELETEKEMQPRIGRPFPKTSRYAFDNGDGDRAEMTVTWTEELEVRDTYGDAPANAEELKKLVEKLSDMAKVIGGTKEQFDAAGIAPAYVRYYAEGNLRLTLDGRTETSSGDMIYEYNYTGREDPRAGV